MNAVVATLRSIRLRALLALGMVLGLGTVGTLAAWSATTTTASGNFVTGTVDITVDNSDGAPQPFVLAVPTGALFPGRSAAVLVSVRNAGTLGFTYTTAVATAGQLGSNVVVTGRAGAGVAATGGTTCAGADTGVITSTRAIARNALPDVLCLQFTLANLAPNSSQGQSGTATVTFQATGQPSA
ncbi:hypothetical protein HQ312_17010 [Rhodococcus sp. BP-316]|uniref:SipW-dependent-type signal peptide-containing protein n=1 Tax=Rhodococcus sp. BP-316 TaxID=2739445 RepID=UPI001C9B18AD|nr:SipW-dependent-type signal peptide-containing protein [Rhodococcus sp. BP-316]MBY6682757.1 hypothetical protein [Rhodococcus sp. BP-316]